MPASIKLRNQRPGYTKHRDREVRSVLVDEEDRELTCFERDFVSVRYAARYFSLDTLAWG